MVRDGKMLPVLNEQHVLYVDDPHHIVRGFLIHGEPGIAFFPKHLKQFIKPCIDIDEGHVNPGYHDIRGHRIAQVEYVVNHFLFF